MLTGIALLIGSVWGMWRLHKFKFDLRSLLLGIYGIVGFHLFYFLGLRNAPVFEANLINYLWPLLIVVLAPLITKQKQNLKSYFFIACGFLGLLIALEVFTRSQLQIERGHLYSLVGAIVWSTYSLLLPQSKHSAWDNSVTCFLSGVICLSIAAINHSWSLPTNEQWPWLIYVGLCPLGLSFYLWEFGARRVSASHLGNLSYLTPLLSMFFLSLAAKSTPSLSFWIGFAIVVLSSFLSTRGKRADVTES